MVSDGSWVVRVQAAKILVSCVLGGGALARVTRGVTFDLCLPTGFDAAGESTFFGADAGQETDVRPQGKSPP